jgi:hypothetical protein
MTTPKELGSNLQLHNAFLCYFILFHFIFKSSEVTL